MPCEHDADEDGLARCRSDWCTTHDSQMFGDGSVSEASGAGGGCALWGCGSNLDGNPTRQWRRPARASWLLPCGVLPIEAQFCGTLSALRFLMAVLR